MKNFCLIFGLFFIILTTLSPAFADDETGVIKQERIKSVGNLEFQYDEINLSKITKIGDKKVVYLNDALRDVFYASSRGVHDNYVDPTILDRIGNQEVVYRIRKINGKDVIHRIGKEKFTYDKTGKLLSIGDKQCEYDNNGKLSKIGDDIVTWEIGTYIKPQRKSSSSYSTKSIKELNSNNIQKTKNDNKYVKYNADGTIYKIGNDSVKYNTDGTIYKIGNDTVKYNADGSIYKIGNDTVKYNADGTIYKIGNNSVKYNADGSIYKIGNDTVKYNADGSIYKIGN